MCADCFLVSLRLGRIGYHIDVVETVDPHALKPWAQVLVVAPILYSAACALPKIVLLTLYLRIFNERKYRVSCYVVMRLVVALGVADNIAGATECIPLASLWDKTIDGNCFDLATFYRWGTLPNVIVDFLMLLLLVPVIWKLQVFLHVKVDLTATFLTGSV